MNEERKEGEFPCHIENYVHPPHPWTPIVADPENPRVLHVMAEVQCPGVGYLPSGSST